MLAFDVTWFMFLLVQCVQCFSLSQRLAWPGMLKTFLTDEIINLNKLLFKTLNASLLYK